MRSASFRACACQIQPNSVAAATASAAASAARRGRGGFRGIPVAGGSKDRELKTGFLAGALGADNFLLLVDHNALEARITFIAKIFVDGHAKSFS